MKLVYRLVTLLIMSFAVHAAPVSAQVEGSRFTRYATKADAGRAFRMWAGCVADLDRKWARALLETVPTSDGEGAMLDKRAGTNDRCLEDSRLLLDGKELVMSPESARGEIARFLARKQLGSGASSPVTGAASAWLVNGVAALPEKASFHRPILIGHDFAACLADDYWSLVRAFVAAEPDSGAETTALQALSPKFSGCMTSGAKLNLNKPLLRLLLSEAAYHALTYRPSSLIEATPRPAQ